MLALLAWRLSRGAKNLASRELVMIGVLVGCVRFWSPRPLMVGLLCLATTILLAEDERLPAWWLAPLGWLWMNSHGSWPIGVGYLLVRLVGRSIDRGDSARLLHLLRWAAVGAALGAIGPVGPKILVFPFHLLFRHAVLSHVMEWTSPSFSSLTNLVFLAVALVTLALASRGGWEDALPSVLFVAMALMAMRNIPVASLILCPVFARHLPPMAPTTRPGHPNAVVSIALAALVTIGAAASARALTRPAYDLRTYPVSELAWMRSHSLLSERVAAPDDVGNYRTWSEGAHAEVFMDDRFDMYPPSLINATATLTGGLPGWDAVLDRYRIAVVLWHRQSPLAEILGKDPQWKVVHQTAGWIVVTRAVGASA
jgi:hypothetical protein